MANKKSLLANYRKNKKAIDDRAKKREKRARQLLAYKTFNGERYTLYSKGNAKKAKKTLAQFKQTGRKFSYRIVKKGIYTLLYAKYNK
jgi:hypothetical protein